MQASMILWSIWGAVFAGYVVIRIYMMRLSRDEDDQLVLQESTSHVKAEQAEIMSRLNKVEPIQRLMMWGVIGMSVIVVCYYVVDMIRQFQ
jgi:hypothetical protein